MIQVGAVLTPDDLEVMGCMLAPEVANAMIDDLEAQVLEVCEELLDPAHPYAASVKAILRQAALRWHRAGEGGLSSQQMASGPFSFTQSYDTRTSGQGRLYPSEVQRLRALCRAGQQQGAPTGRRASTYLPGRGILR